jgi:excinuclease UvrABC helicase subunit UvrB
MPFQLHSPYSPPAINAGYSTTHRRNFKRREILTLLSVTGSGKHSHSNVIQNVQRPTLVPA